MRRLVAILVVLAVLGFGTSRVADWWNFNVNTAVSSKSEPVVFRVDPGELPNDIINDLYSQHLIRDRNVFELYARLIGATSRFQAGTFVLNRNMTTAQIVSALEHGRPDQVAVTIPEGFPIKFQAQYVERSGLSTAAAYIAATQDTSLASQYEFLRSRPPNAKPPLEGYLFPDTYLLDKSAGVKALITAQLDQFDRIFSSDLRNQIKQPTAARPAESVESIVVLASMVEREANTESDRGKVCSVYYNRLRQRINLGVDATLLYALGRLTPEPTAAELELNTPYNTRMHPGLPPGPIGNPGKAALLSCINPPQTQFLFYFTDRAGVTHFETNEQDFERDKKIYGLSGS